MNWRAQSFAKVFGLNALPIKLLPSKGGQGTQVGGGSGRQVDEVRKEGRTKRKRNGGGWPKGKKRKVKPKATPPKPPATAYGLFLSEQRQAVTERHTFKSMAQLSRKIGRMWGETSDDQKQVYYERASKDRQRYLEELKTYISKIHKENSAESLEKVNSVLTQCLENEENNDLLVCHICQTSFITLHNKRSHYTGKMHTDMLWEQLNKLLGDASKTTSAKTTNSSTEGTTIKKRKRKSVCCHGDGDQDDPNRDGLARAGSGDEGQSQTELEVEPSCNGHTPGQDTVMEGVVSGGSATPPASGSPPLRGGSEEFCNDPTLTGGQSAEELSQEVEVSVADSPGCGRGGSCDVVEAKDVPDDNFAQNDVQCTSVSTNGAEQSDPQAVPSDDTTTEPLNVPTATNQSCQPVMSCDTPAGEGCHGDSHVPQSLQQWAQSYTGENMESAIGFKSSVLQNCLCQCMVVLACDGVSCPLYCAADLLEELEERRASHCSNLEHYSKLQAQDEAKESALTFLLDEFRSEERALTDCINKLLHTLQRIATS